MFPLHDSLDYVVWAPREFNTVADHAVNVALDTGGSCKWVEESVSKNDWPQGRFRLCVDGGLRDNGQAAAGLALFLFQSDGTYGPLRREGKILTGVGSSFEAEVLALEWAIEVFKASIFNNL